MNKLHRLTPLLIWLVAPLANGLQLFAKPTKLKVFILAAQSNMDGQAYVRTIDFLGISPCTSNSVRG